MKTSETGTLSLGEFRKANVARCWRFHPEKGAHSWDAKAWTEAVVGEVGEAFNEMKKLRRGDGNRSKVVLEWADAFTYSDLLDERMGYKTDSTCGVDALAEEIDEKIKHQYGLNQEAFFDAAKGSILHGLHKMYVSAMEFDIAESLETSFDRQASHFLGVGAISLWMIRYFGWGGAAISTTIASKFNEVSIRRSYPERLVLLGGEWKFATQ